MKPQSCTPWRLSLLLSFLVAALPAARADVLYENISERSTPERFAESGYEFGEEIVMPGAQTGTHVVTNFAYEYFGYGPDFASNTVTVTLRFYANDGVGGLPGTVLFNSGAFTIPATPGSGSVISYAGLNVTVPKSFTYTVQFAGFNSGTGVGLQAAGLDLYGVPTVGLTYDDYWERSGAGSTWVLRAPTPGNPPINFGCVVEGTFAGPPAIARQPQSKTATVPGSTTLSVSAIGTAPLSYQWRFQGVALVGATSSTLTLNNLDFDDLGYYSVVVANSLGSVTSAPALLLLESPVLYENRTTRSDPERFAQSGYEFGEEIVLAGNGSSYVVTNFSFEYFGYGPDFTSNNVSVNLRFYANDGSNGVPGTVLLDSGFFTIPATGPEGSVLTYAGLNVTVGKSFTWTVEFQGLNPGTGAGLQSAGLDLYGVPTVGQTYNDYWERSGAGGTWELRVPSPGQPPINFGCAAVGSYLGAPVFNSQPRDLVSDGGPGSQAIFTSYALGTAPLSYQWNKGGVPIPGATNSFLLLQNLSYADSGNYSVTASNSVGTTNSRTASLLVNNAPVVPTRGGATSENLPLTFITAKLLQGVTDAEGDTFALASVGPVSLQGGTLTSNATTYVYTPPTGFTGTDSFQVFVRDNRGAVGVGIVQILVVSGSLPGQNTIVIQLAPGGIQVRFAGIPGRSYQIQRSTDLVNWNTLQIETAAPYGVIQYLDTAPPPGAGFYRTLAVP
ncbi:MAG: hypothetical protein RJA22_518 [Verrucomicrobiota bacterium]|jgi:hypothetical protein